MKSKEDDWCSREPVAVEAKFGSKFRCPRCKRRLSLLWDDGKATLKPHKVRKTKRK